MIFTFTISTRIAVLAVSFISSLMIGLILTPLLLNQKQPPGTKTSLKKKIEVDTVSGN